MKLPKDTPIIVWDTPDQKHHGHFHSFTSDGKVMVWPYGSTSHTAVVAGGVTFDHFSVVDGWEVINRHAEVLAYHLYRKKVCEAEAYDFFKKLEEEYKYGEVIMEMSRAIDFNDMTEGEAAAVAEALRTLAKEGFRRD